MLLKARRGGRPTGIFATAEAPSTVIRPYKLLERIGEGGMGEVWMAQQQEPVRRKVAVKLIKAGMDSKQVVARFEAERQAAGPHGPLASPEYLDGGTTDAGLPYFVMELVKGVPVTKYCDEHRLTPRERLELFLPVCQAVQHAHQKGVIHRDLKPSNVLVAPYDGEPVPKVIDFGVAKAAGVGDGEDAVHRVRRGGRHAGVHVAGAGGAEQPGHRHPQRRVLAGGDAELLTGTTPLESRRLKSRRCWRALQPDPRGGADHPQHEAEHGEAAVAGGRPGRGRAAAQRAGARRGWTGS
ncbi:MAG: serine/threonine-protein kinase [Gemmataceae bacterium]